MRRRTGPRASIISVLLLGCLIFGGVYYAWNTMADVFQPVAGAGQGRNVNFVISPGESTGQIAENLQKAGLIKNALAFRVWAQIKGLDTRLQAGVYNNLNTSMSISQIIDQLLDAQPVAKRVNIPEGWRIEQMAARFADSGLVKFKADEFLKYTRDYHQFPDAGKYDLLKQIPQNQKSMEGLLFPATYDVPVDGDAKTVIGLMLKSMTETIQKNQIDQKAQKLKKSVYEIITLASIIEREARFPEDRKPISSVYWNRLNNPQYETVGFLNADPTVQYGRDTANPPKDGKYWTPLADAAKNIVPDNAYNTYTKKGLTPTPIASPGLASLLATVDPAATDYYYFVTDKTGHAHFAKTGVEFEKLLQQYPQ